jgi:hypothetical protein
MVEVLERYWLDQLFGNPNLKFEKQENLRLVWSLQCSTIGWLLVLLSLVMQENFIYGDSTTDGASFSDEINAETGLKVLKLNWKLSQ